MSRPTLTFIAGANGSGKTTLTRWNPELFKEIPLLDPDAIANTLQTETSALFPVAAARHVLEASRRHLERAESFAIETNIGRKELSADDVVGEETRLRDSTDLHWDGKR